MNQTNFTTTMPLEKMYYAVLAFLCACLTYKLYPKEIFLFSVLSIYFLSYFFIKDFEKKNMLRISIFILLGTYAPYRGYHLYLQNPALPNIYGFHFIACAYLWSYVIASLFSYWIRTGDSKNHEYSYKKREQDITAFYQRISLPLLGKERLEVPIEVPIDNSSKLKIIGSINARGYKSFDLIGALISDKTVIPFRLQCPFVITTLDLIPVISLCVTHIGFALNYLPRNRDWLPFYNSSIFADQNFHGYEFASEEEYEVTKNKIQEGIKRLFLKQNSQGEALAYCIEVCFLGNEWSYDLPGKIVPKLSRARCSIC